MKIRPFFLENPVYRHGKARSGGVPVPDGVPGSLAQPSATPSAAGSGRLRCCEDGTVECYFKGLYRTRLEPFTIPESPPTTCPGREAAVHSFRSQNSMGFRASKQCLRWHGHYSFTLIISTPGKGSEKRRSPTRAMDALDVYIHC